MKHPLHLHGKQARYGNSISRLEQKYSTASMVAACEFSIDKYQERLGKKSHISGIIKEALDAYFVNRPEQYELFRIDHLTEVEKSDKKKIETYKAYKDSLVPLLHNGHAKLTVSHAYQLESIEYDD